MFDILVDGEAKASEQACCLGRTETTPRCRISTTLDPVKGGGDFRLPTSWTSLDIRARAIGWRLNFWVQNSFSSLTGVKSETSVSRESRLGESCQSLHLLVYSNARAT